MKKGLTLLLLISFSLSQSFAQLTGFFTWNPVIEMDNQIYPSYVWANANRNYLSQTGKAIQTGPEYFGDPQGQIGITINTRNLIQTQNVKVVVSSPDIMETSEISCQISKSNSQIDIFPKIRYKWSVLSKWRQPRPVNISISVYINGRYSRTEVLTVTMRSINDCPFIFLHRSGIIHDMSFMFAAYVNENHPKINDVILPEILRDGTIKQVIGYQGTVDNVYEQVYAVWKHLRQRGVTYSSLTSQAHYSNKLPSVASQYVRTFDDAYNSRQANCVDGTVLMASILYRMGLKPVIVIRPGHCFLGVSLDESKNNFIFIETTMIGMTVSPALSLEMRQKTLFNKAVLHGMKDGDDFHSFTAALLAGLEEYNKAKNQLIINSNYNVPQLTNKSVDQLAAALQYQLFEVEKFRKEGLLPIILE